jgi:2-desacetyl-2-hydroxyethyl bacteriochlorophyllide A dehydrogenase
MKRLIVTASRQVEFEEVPEPECPADGILVKAKVTAISQGTEIRVYRVVPVDEAGEFLHAQIPFQLPAENGYSMVGEVKEVGSDVRVYSIGDRVFVPCSHKQYAAVSANLAVKLSDEIPDEEAAFLNILEVSHIALRRGNPSVGENVAIIGQGVIGLSALAYCCAFGFRTLAVDLNERRLAISKKTGADLVLSPNETGFVEKIQNFFGGDGADVVIEATSRWKGIRTAMEAARTEGKVIVVSRNTEVPDFNPVGHPFLGKKLELLTSYGYPHDGDRWDRSRSIELTLDLLSRGKLNVKPMITHRLNWDELPEAYRRLDEGDPEMVGTVLRWS